MADSSRPPPTAVNPGGSGSRGGGGGNSGLGGGGGTQQQQQQQQQQQRRGGGGGGGSRGNRNRSNSNVGGGGDDGGGGAGGGGGGPPSSSGGGSGGGRRRGPRNRSSRSGGGGGGRPQQQQHKRGDTGGGGAAAPDTKRDYSGVSSSSAGGVQERKAPTTTGGGGGRPGGKAKSDGGEHAGGDQQTAQGGGGHGRGGRQRQRPPKKKTGIAGGAPSSEHGDSQQPAQTSGAPSDPSNEKPSSRGKRKSRPSRSAAKKREEERLRLEAEATKRRLAAEAEAAEKKRLEELEAERLRKEAEEAAERERLRKLREEHEAKVRDGIGTLRALVCSTAQHGDWRERTSPGGALAESRASFQRNKKTLKTDLKKCTALVRKVKGLGTSSSASSAAAAASSSSSGSGSGAAIDDALLRDVRALNLSRYVEEVAAAILDAKIKVPDLPTVVELCGEMHLRYEDFMPVLLPGLVSALKGPGENEKQRSKGGGGGGDEESAAGGGGSAADRAREATRHRRMCLRLLTELLLTGVVRDARVLSKVVAEAAGAPSSSSISSGGDKSGGGGGGTYAVNDANLVVSFAKAAGHEMLGVTARSVRMEMEFLRKEVELAVCSAADSDRGDDAEGADGADVDAAAEASGEGEGGEGTEVERKTKADITTDGTIIISSELANEAKAILDKSVDALTSRAVSVDSATVLRTHCLGTHKTLCTSLVSTHAKLQKLEKRCEADRLLQGSLSEGREKGLADARKLLDSLRKSVEALSEVLDRNVPELKEEEEDANAAAAGFGSGTGVELYKAEEDDNEDGINLGPFDDEETRSFYTDIPDLLTTIPPALLGLTPADVESIQMENVRKYGQEGGEDEDVGEAGGESSTAVEGGAGAAEGDAEGLEDGEDGSAGAVDKEEADATADDKDTPHYRLKVLLEQELPECNRREKIDELAEKFCVNHGSSKPSRKRLSRTLFLVPRTRLDLLPYYSRLAAILDRVFPDVSPTLVSELEAQFHGQARWKKQVNLEGRLRNARFLGELTKFRVAPPIVVLRCLRRCLDDFTGYNIDVACSLLESCGRYLHRTKHTRARLSALMDVMMRIRKAKNLDERSVALINSAFFMVNPPQSPTRKQTKVVPPLEAYLRHLLMVRLVPDEKTIAFVSKQILRLPWSDPTIECGSLVTKYMLKACRKGRYKAIGSVASVASNVKRSKPEVPTRVVDAVLEELQWALEHPSFRDQQRTVVHSRLLGELHRSSLVSASVIFEQLYRFVNVGHEIPEALREASEKTRQEEEEANSDAAAGGGGVTGGGAGGGSVVVRTTSGASQTIPEDEEVDDEDLTSPEEEESPKQPEVVAVSVHSKYDPRVPSIIDLPNSAFRVKLVCTLLESVLPSIVTKNTLPKLDGFLASFQRYLFTKTLLPTEVEFSLLDTFDALDSQWKRVERGDHGGASSRSSSGTGGKGKNSPARTGADAESSGFVRYSTWLEAHNATVKAEETDALLEARARARLEAQGGVLSNANEKDAEGASAALEEDDIDDLEKALGQLSEDDDEEEDDSIDDPLSLNSAKDGGTDDSELDTDEDEEEDDSSDADSEDGSDVSDDSEDDEDDVSDDDSEDESEDDLSEEEELDEAAAEEAYMRQLEEEAFERELRKLTMDALEKGKAAARLGGKVSDTMPAASQFVNKKALFEGTSNVGISDAGMSSDAAGGGSGGDPNAPKMALGGGEGVSFKLLKRGHKGRVEARQLVVPTDTNLAILATRQDDEAAKERDMLKARVLQYEAESAEQQYSGGNVYMDQAKLQVIRNRPLSMEVIDRNFGSGGGGGDSNVGPSPSRNSGDRSRGSSYGYGGRGSGRGSYRGRGHGGRGLV